MQPINIWSGSKVPLGAALTNPTELSFRKRKIKFHYPIEFRGRAFADAEAAYKHYKTGDLREDMAIMTEIIVAKLQQHPKLFNAIAANGGIEWLEQCSHRVVGNVRWEGVGRESNFIVCLIRAYAIVDPVTESTNLIDTAFDRDEDISSC
ncbi:hypothetical protein ACE1CD_15495 [Aerosakkonema sp. BLCC-F183]|uniref:hypothetical protein n=1 Tax=Aerosakkonema sp. BLCC-F183 TaxID=3342834 RepID=UPI0035B83AAA